MDTENTDTVTESAEEEMSNFDFLKIMAAVLLIGVLVGLGQLAVMLGFEHFFNKDEPQESCLLMIQRVIVGGEDFDGEPTVVSKSYPDIDCKTFNSLEK